MKPFTRTKDCTPENGSLPTTQFTLNASFCKEAGGIQVQIAASFEGFNRINFSREGYTVNPIIISTERKQARNARLMLFFTGFLRFFSGIQKAMEEKGAEFRNIFKSTFLLGCKMYFGVAFSQLL